MKIKSVLFAITIIITAQSFGQEVLAMFRGDNGKFGFLNMKGEVVIEPKYTSTCKSFRSGMAKIDKTHFINLKDERIYPKHRVIEAGEYSDGLVAIKTTKNWGYMNRAGELVIPDIYKYVTDFDNGYAVVKKKNDYFIIDKEGNEQQVMVSANEKIKNIKKITEGLAPIEIAGHFGFINEKGKIAIGTMFLGVGYFNGGIAWARTVNNKIGFIDKTGNWVIEPVFDSAREFDTVSGLAKVHGKEGWGYVNMKGELKQFDNSRDHQRFFDGMCRETKQMGNAKSGYLNSEGNWAIEPIFGIAGHFNNGFANVRFNGKWGIINKKGEYVVESKYSYIDKPHLAEE